MIDFICPCGDTRVARRSRVKNGEITCCVACSRRNASNVRKQPEQKKITDRFHEYKINARRKCNEFSLTKQQVVELLRGDCTYCGIKQSFGIDRQDNAIGYTTDNSIPCCSKCNYAKRGMSKSDFMGWVRLVCNHAK